MRSIRRSLIIYFLGLTAFVLLAVGFIIDRVLTQTLMTRKNDRAEVIQKQYEGKRSEILEQADEALLLKAQSIAMATNFHYTTNFRFETDAFNRRMQALQYATLGMGLANPLGVATTYAVTTPTQPVYWRLYGQLSNNYMDRLKIDDSFLTFLDSTDHLYDLYQVHSIRDKIWRSITMGDLMLPGFDKAKLARTNFLWVHDDAILSDGTPVRRVVFPFAVTVNLRPPTIPFGMRRSGDRNSRNSPQFNFPPPPPTASPQTPAQAMEEYQRQIPRFYVQAARPMAAIEEKMNEYRELRDIEIANLISSTNQDRDALRAGYLATSSLALGALLIGALIITRHGLQPLDRLSRAVANVSEKDFQLPVKASELSTELLPVHSRITDTLSSLKRAFEREKQAVADISHELRTPIAALAATLEVSLRKPRTVEQYQTTLRDSRDINRQLARLVDRIMMLANLDAGNDQIQIDTIDATSLINDCAAVIRPIAESNTVTFAMQLNPPLQVRTDPNMLREVLVNLLHNAVEYNKPEGTITLFAAIEADKLVFRISDTGIGMTPEIRSHIFERFFRADSSRNATGIHAGLGLAVVREYIERLNGTITVASEPNVGSTFTVTFPTA